MLKLLETNLKYKNLKKDILKNFPTISSLSLNSMYAETLRGQIRKKYKKFEQPKKIFKWKKLYYNNFNSKNNYKNYIIRIPNLLEKICPEDININNIKFYTKETLKAIQLISKKENENFKEEHALILLVLWDIVGRFRTIEKEVFLEELSTYIDIREINIDILLDELAENSLIVEIKSKYGIHRKIIL